MTVKECYEAMGGNYDDVMSRLRTDERVIKFLLKVRDDKSYEMLTASLKDGNIEEAFRAAHTIKGVCMNLSLTKLYESSGKLTEALRGHNEIGGEVKPLFEKLKEDYELTMDCIGRLQ